VDSVRFSVFTLRVREDGELILHVVYSRRVDADFHARGQNVFVRVEVVQRVTFVVPVAIYFIKELMIPENSFYMFFVEYVIFGTLAFAIVIPFIPRHLLRGFDWYPMIKKMGFKS